MRYPDADDPVRWLLSPDLLDEQGQWVHGRIRYDRISSAPGARHAGVIVILSLVCQMLADAAVLPDLRRGGDSRGWSCQARCWVVAVSPTELEVVFQ